MQAFQTIGSGNIPIILHLPHNSTHLPNDFEWNLDRSILAMEIHRLVDHHTLELFQPLIDAGAVALCNNLCRLYCDPERFADRQQETMNNVGMGVFYTHTTEGERFREADTDRDYERKLKHLYHPYHRRFTAMVEGMLSRFDRVLIIDGHSYPKSPLPYEQYPNLPRPEIDIGTWTQSDCHTSPELIAYTRGSFEDAGYSVALNSPFKGAIMPMKFIGDTRVQTMMLEVRRDVYLCPESYEGGQIHLDSERLSRFHTVLQKLGEDMVKIGR